MRRKLQSILENTTAQEILNYIAAFRHPRGGPPCLREICMGCDVSMGYASKLIKRLASEGHLVKQGRDWYGVDIPNRKEIEEQDRLKRAHWKMMREDK